MRSHVFSTTCVFFFLVATSIGVVQIDCSDAGVSLPVCAERTPYFFAATEYLSWKATQPGNDFAVTDSGSALIVGEGEIQRVSLDTNPGYRAQIGYMTSAGWSVSGSYTYFDADAASRIDRPIGSGQLFATRSHPDGNQEADVATGFASFDYNVFDLIVQRSVAQTSFSDFRIFGGIRWASIDQTLRSELDGRDFSNGLIQNATSTDAAGIRFGTDASWRIAKGFYLYGRTSGGVLFAETNSEQLETNFSGSDVLVDVSDRRDRSLPFVDTRLGLGWKRDAISILVGYELENWFGLQDRSMFVDNGHEGAFSVNSDDVLLSGLFVRMTIQR